MKQQIYQENYTINRTNIQLVMPLNFEVLIPEDDSVRLLSQITEELDYTDLKMAYSSKGRNPAVPARILFQILVYAYMNGIYSSRKIERACRRDINFIWLLERSPAPDHNTIARFRSGRLSDTLEKLFNQLVLKLNTLSEISFENLFVDGTKIEANANKYTFVWKKAVDKNELKLKEKTGKLITEINKEYTKAHEVSDKVANTLEEIILDLGKEKVEKEIEFVYGTGKRKSKLQRHMEKANEHLERHQKYDKYNGIFDGRNSFSKTDTDATFMHMKEDHMRNSQLKPGYNVQIGVEGGYVVGVDIFSERSDQLTLIPFLDKLKNNFPYQFKNVIADAGYESEENYLYLEQNKHNPYIKPQIYEQWKKKNFKNLIGKRENMDYDSENNTYTCNQGRKLAAIGIGKRTTKSGYEAQITTYECESCEGCSVKNRCTRAKGNRKMDVSRMFLEKRAVSWQNIMTPQGIMLRMNRSIQVEGVFGITKEDYGFRRFFTREKHNVKTEYLLLCFGFNINRLHQKIQSKKTGQLLYKKEVA